MVHFSRFRATGSETPAENTIVGMKPPIDPPFMGLCRPTHRSHPIESGFYHAQMEVRPHESKRDADADRYTKRQPGRRACASRRSEGRHVVQRGAVRGGVRRCLRVEVLPSRVGSGCGVRRVRVHAHHVQDGGCFVKRIRSKYDEATLAMAAMIPNMEAVARNSNDPENRKRAREWLEEVQPEEREALEWLMSLTPEERKAVKPRAA